MDIQTLEIVRKANRLTNELGTNDPHKIARELGIEVIPLSFKKQRGAYKVLMRNRFIFIKDDLHPVMERIVMLHEIGHDALHREEAVKAGGFKEFNIFDMRQSRMEYEANIFASQISLPDDEILEYIENGYDIQQIARAMHSDINLVALKTDTLIAQGYRFRHQEWLNKRHGKGRRVAVFGVFNKFLIADNFCLAQIASPSSIIFNIQHQIPHFLKFAGDQRFYI